MWQRFSERARRAVFFAQEEASRRATLFVQPEHLFLALLRDDESIATQVLLRLDLAIPELREAVESRCETGQADVTQDMQLAPAAKRVIDHAYEEARRLNNNYIGSEHLLLGVIQIKDGIPAQVLAERSVDLESARKAVFEMQESARQSGAGEDVLLQSEGDVRSRPWLDQLRSRLMGTPSPSTPNPPVTPGQGTAMWARFTERARRVVFFAQEESVRLGESYVGTEHLLLALCRESDTVAARLLERLGTPLDRVRTEIERQVTRGHGNLGKDMQLTPRSKRVIDLAYDEARRLGNDFIGTEHLLLGLIREGDGLAARVLVKLGASLERTRDLIVEVVEQSSQGSAAWTPLTRLASLATEDRGYATVTAAAQTAREAVGYARMVCDGLTDLVGIEALEAERIQALVGLALILKRSLNAGKTAHRDLLTGKTLAMIFEKPSLRTRVSFETGMVQFGGHAIYLQPADIAMGKRETVPDVARVLDRMVDGIMGRVFAHRTILELAEHARAPVINGLCDREHPCQALADALTLVERGREVKGQRIVYVGDGNNVCHSLMLLAAKLGAHFVVSGPEGYDPDSGILDTARQAAAASGGSVELVRDPHVACAAADVVYTDTWASMGQEAEAAERARIFAPYQVNAELVAFAKPDYLLMHCLPAHRDEEVTSALLDGPNSVVFDQAENRLHAQKAVLAVLLR